MTGSDPPDHPQHRTPGSGSPDRDRQQTTGRTERRWCARRRFPGW